MLCPAGKKIIGSAFDFKKSIVVVTWVAQISALCSVIETSANVRCAGANATCFSHASAQLLSSFKAGTPEFL